jgi:hypothetical protein
MSHAFSLAPGFSPVAEARDAKNCFNSFVANRKPLKRLIALRPENTRLKPGANEKK